MQRMQLIACQAKVPLSKAIEHISTPTESKLNLNNCKLIIERLNQHLSEDTKLLLDRLTQESYV
ncbi:MAG: hypothetical protein EX285_08025 [Thaumarchaeota archaeon]|nr:hypothetical protein [Nitrososphaerota archaeon]